MANDKDHLQDEQWLAALAGHSDSSASPDINRQAQLVRDALLKRQEQIDRIIPESAEGNFQQLLRRLDNEGLMKLVPPKQTWSLKNIAALLWPMPQAFALATTLALGIAIGLIVQHQKKPEEQGPFAVRGEQATILLVADPLEKVVELRNGLRAVGSSPEIIINENRIVLKVKQTDPVLDYLISQRITQPTIVDGQVVLAIERARK